MTFSSLCESKFKSLDIGDETTFSFGDNLGVATKWPDINWRREEKMAARNVEVEELSVIQIKWIGYDIMSWKLSEAAYT